MDEKSVGLSADEQLEDQCIDELLQACADKDPGKFRSAIEALVMNGFEDDEAA